MFVGEFLCLGVYGAKLLYLKYYGKQNESVSSPGQAQAETLHLKTNINPLLLAIPASFDCIASTLMNIALTMVVASVYQMLRGLIIVITAIMSVIFLKRKLYRHHWSSMSVIFIGVFLVGLAKFLDPSADKGGETKFGGLALLVVAQLFAGCLLIVEEKLLGDYYLDPLKVVGLEGMWGIIFWCVLLPILQ
jgi:drug/metabolite transporter (DMT)-like permease